MRFRAPTVHRELVHGVIRGLRPASALVVPVPEAAPAVRAWWGTDMPRGTLPAHITVMYPFLPARALDDRVEAELARIAALVPPFGYRLTEVGRFPGVLYLRPDPPGRFADLSGMVTRNWPACLPYGGKYAEFVPHVTLAVAESARGDTERLTPLLPIACHAEELALLTESARGWHISKRLPLCGTAP